MWQDASYTRLCEDSKYLGLLLQIMNTSDTKLLKSHCSCDVGSSSSFGPTFSKHTFHSSKGALGVPVAETASTYGLLPP